MKKLVAILLGVLSLCCLFGCKDKKAEINKFTNLENNKTLFVADPALPAPVRSLANVETSTTEKEYLTVLKSIKYVLHNDGFEGLPNAVKVGEKWYYWTETDVVTDEVELGERTDKTTIQYSYMTYGEDKENIAVKTTITEKTTLAYKDAYKNGGLVAINFSVEFDFTNASEFANFAAVQTASAELAGKIDADGSMSYYIDVTVPEYVDTSISNYLSVNGCYYYFE